LDMFPLIVTIKDDISLTVILNSSHAQITKRLYNSLAFAFIFFKKQIYKLKFRVSPEVDLTFISRIFCFTLEYLTCDSDLFLSLIACH